jgi:omega-amidase
MSTLTITLIQTALHWEDKNANLQMLEEKINSIKEKTELVILPEMFSTAFSMDPKKLAEKMDGPTVTWMKKLAESKKIILTGSIIVEDDDEGEIKYRNRLIWMLPNGQMGFYDKRHAFAFAGEDKFYTSGNKRLIASVKGWKINLQICYDLRFPIWARQSSHQSEKSDDSQADWDKVNNLEYDLIVYVANWPERRVHAWKTLLQARAIENQCFVAGVNRVGNDGNGIYHSGESMVVDPMGEVLYEKAHEEDIFTITIHKQKLEEIRNKFPFWRDADDFMIL